MADDEATTTTTVDENTTTTTTEAPAPFEQPTGKSASANYAGGDASPNAERQGEVKIDKKADTDVLGYTDPKDDRSAADQDADVSAQNIENAKAEALRNAARETQPEPRQNNQ